MDLPSVLSKINNVGDLKNVPIDYLKLWSNNSGGDEGRKKKEKLGFGAWVC